MNDDILKQAMALILEETKNLRANFLQTLSVMIHGTN